MQKVKMVKDCPLIPTPSKGTSESACYDVVATSVENLGDGRIVYGTGLHLSPTAMTQIDLRARSSIHKTGLILANGIGTGDEDYTGEYKVVFYHVIKELEPYKIGDKILQIQVVDRSDIEFVEVDSLEETERGDGGFGSTGK